MKKKTVWSAVCLLALLAAATACGDSGNTGTATVETAPTTEALTEAVTEAVTEDDRPALALPDTDFGGAELKILEYERYQEYASNNCIHYHDFIWTKDESGDLVNDAIMKRNMTVEERYNCVIKSETVGNPAATAKKFITAGSSDYDVVEIYINDAMSMATNGMLYNFYDIPNISMDQSWWDSAIQRDLAIKGQLYVMTGDISVYDEELNFCVFFNKKMAEDYDIESPYQMVRDNKWTLDRMYQLGRTASRDLNGDGVRDENDSWGVLSDGGMLWLFYYTSGCTIVEMDNEGEPYFTAGSERASTVADYLVQFFSDKESVLWAAHCSNSWTTLDTVLMENRGLFRPGSVYDITYYRNMQTDFGILPYPKYDEGQDYYHVIATQLCPGITVPTTNPNIERTGFLLEALAYESRNTVTKAYYDVNLYSKLARDNESGEMFDIIFATKRYDLARVFDWGGMNSVLTSLASSKKTFASIWASKESSAEKAKEKTMTFFRENA